MSILQTLRRSAHQKAVVIFIMLLSLGILNSCFTKTDPNFPTVAPTNMPTLIPTSTPTMVPISPTPISSTIFSTQKAYYVDSILGSDSNPGTQSQPFRSIQRAADVAYVGDTVIVLAGTYNERVGVINSGMPGASVTYQAQGTVVMQGFTVKANYITIKGFEITNTPNDDQDGFGIFVQAGNCDIEDNYVYFATRGGIQLDTSSDHCIIRNNRLYRDSQYGIGINGLDHLVEGNEIWDSIQYHPKWLNPPPWVDADGIRFFGSGHILRGNYIHDINYSDPLNVNPHIDCFQTFTDANHQAASNITIEQNRCDNDALVKSSGEGGTGFTIEGGNNIMIRNNVIDAFANVFLINTNNVSVLNNTLIGNLRQNLAFYPVGVELNATINTVVENNIFYNQPGNIIYINGNPPVSGRNLVYRNDGQLISMTNTYHPVTDLWGINPLLVDPAASNYHLKAGSPAINAGLNLGDLVPNDFDGISRPQDAGYDIGAYEYHP